MRIENHKLSGVRFQEAQWIWGEITPEIAVLHDTASRMTPGNAADYLARNDAKVSVHFVVESDGAIIQQVPTNRRAGHAGKSTFNGRNDCNAFSIGIEIVNPGRMSRIDEKRARTWYGEELAIGLFGIQEVETPQHGRGLWMPYSEAQIGAVLKLLTTLFRDIPTLNDITTHWYVSPGRKVDTNPLFPLEHVRARVLGRDDPADLAAEAGSEPANSQDLVMTDTPGDTLSLRRWPSFNPNVLTMIPDATVLPVLRRGTFNGRVWLCVQYGGHEGWIVETFADPFTH